MTPGSASRCSIQLSYERMMKSRGIVLINNEMSNSHLYKVAGREAEVIMPDYEDPDMILTNRFGLSLGGDPIGCEDLSRMLDDHSFWNFIDLTGFVRARVSENSIDEEFLKEIGFRKFSNVRERLNVLWHRDTRAFALLARDSRVEKTAFCSRRRVLEVFFKKIGVLVGSSSCLLDRVDSLKKEIDILSKVGMYYEDNNEEDLVGRLISEFIFLVSRDPSVSDADVFKFQKAVDECLIPHFYVHNWSKGDVLFVSRFIFHERVCETVEDVSRVANPLFRLENRMSC